MNLAFIFAIILNFFLWYASIMTVGNILKPLIGDCDKVYVIDKYMKTNFFCQTEDSKIDNILENSERLRDARYNKRKSK